MSFNLNKTKVRVIIALAMIVFVVILGLTVRIIPKTLSIKEISGSRMQVFVKPKPIVKSKQIGYISKVYKEGGKIYLRFDDVKFLTGNAAIEAAKKNGAAGYENGEYFVYNDYYIVNSSKEIKRYVVADNASINLIGWWMDSVSGDINNHSVSHEKFKSISSKYGNMLCYIYTENNVVVKVAGQYTP